MTLLIIGFAGILLMAIVVVIDASAAYLQRQGLDNLADGAALYGADLGLGRDLRAGPRRRAADPAGGRGRGGGPRLPRPGRCRVDGSPGSTSACASTRSAARSRSGWRRRSTCR